jgi:general secretion pathway protein I
MTRGFSLLEVLVAVALLGATLVGLLQLSSQGLRLLQRADDYQQAVRMADRLARAHERLEEGVETGREGRFAWERRVTLVTVPDALVPDPGPPLRLYALSVAVRWGHDQSIELASLRAAAPEPDP